MELSPEERERIFEDERTRIEARSRIARERFISQLRTPAQLLSRLSKRALIVTAILLVIVSLIGWRVRIENLNAAILQDLRVNEQIVGRWPNDEKWRYLHATAGASALKDHRQAVTQFIETLQYAVNSQRVSSSHRNIGIELQHLGLLEAAEDQLRKAIQFDQEGSSLPRLALADVLAAQRKYPESLEILLSLIGEETEVRSLKMYLYDISLILKATDRNEEAREFLEMCTAEDEKSVVAFARSRAKRSP